MRTSPTAPNEEPSGIPQAIQQRPIMLAHSLRALCRTANPHRALSTTAPRLVSSQPSYSFNFLPANSLDPKPARSKGITEIRGPYYAPVTNTYLDELLSDWGEYVDGVKFAGGAFTLMPDDRLRGLIDTCHKHGALPPVLFRTLLLTSCRLLRQHGRLHRARPLRVQRKQGHDIQVPHRVQERRVRSLLFHLRAPLTRAQIRRPRDLLRLPLDPD